MLRAVAAVAALLSVVFLAYGRLTAPEDVRDVVPQLFGEWQAEGGLYEGSRLHISRERVELIGEQGVLESGPLTGIFEVEAGEGYDQYRVEYGLGDEAGAITVMIDDSDQLRLANRPASAWIRAGIGSR